VKLLIIRHGPAGDRAEWEAKGKNDRLRPLTPAGKREVRRVSKGLRELVPELKTLATSPLVRALQTAEIVGERYQTEPVTLEALAPNHDPREVVRWLDEQRSADTLALVGHEPDLGILASFLLGGSSSSFVDLKKSGACLLELVHPIHPPGGQLEWLLTPDVLRTLAR
jgi:phosphohistidine phosphatase